MRDPLGLSIGTTNLVAVRTGQSPVRRSSTLTLSAHRPPQVGVPGKHGDSAETGVSIGGFVERFGERTPLIATDGSAHQPEVLLADAIGAMLETVGDAEYPIGIAVPAHWQPEMWQLLRDALQKPATGLAAETPPQLISDATAALTALSVENNLATKGVVALLDFGGGGTCITLADAARGFTPIGETRRYHKLSGNSIDQAIVSYILGGSTAAGDAAVAGTAMVGDLSRLTEECRRAKERLSAQDAVELDIELPGYRTRIALTRSELEQLVRTPLEGALAELKNMFQSNRIRRSDLVALAAVGGGSAIPLISERLSVLHRVQVLTSQQPIFAAAIGAALCAARAGGGVRQATQPAMAMAAATTAAPRISRPDIGGTAPPPVELAWSQEEIHAGDEPIPFLGEPYDSGFDDGGFDVPPPWSSPQQPRRRPGGRRADRLPQLMLGVGGVVAAVAVVGLGYTLTGATREKTPPAPAPPVSAPAPVPPPSVVVQPSSPAAAPPAPAPVATTAQPAPATTHAEPATTTAEAATTTAEAATTTPPTTAPATTATTAPTTTAAPSTTAPAETATPTESAETSTGVPMRTEYLRIPLVPIPIPIQVPVN